MVRAVLGDNAAFTLHCVSASHSSCEPTERPKLHDRSGELLDQPIVDFVGNHLSIPQLQQTAKMSLFLQKLFFRMPTLLDLMPQLLVRLCQPGGVIATRRSSPSWALRNSCV